MTEQEAEMIKEENERLKQENQALKQLAPKERLYDRIPLSLTAMNRIVGALLVLLVIVLLIALIDR